MDDQYNSHNSHNSHDQQVCRDFMNSRCQRTHCRFKHDSSICKHYWNNQCKFGEKCKYVHIKENELEDKRENKKEGNKEANALNISKKHKRNKDKYNKKKNTETFKPMTKSVDLRIVYDIGTHQLTTQLTDKDVIIVPNLFNEFSENELYNKLSAELNCENTDKDSVFKLWHGDSHFIADDHLQWKKDCPTFLMVVNRIKQFFNMDIKSTRFNYYKDTSQWKPFHFDAAAVKPDKAKTQNFTVAVSFGATREAAFERDTPDKTVVSIPQPDGCIYAFCKDTNMTWRHGILQEKETRNIGRISIIAWGWVDY